MSNATGTQERPAGLLPAQTELRWVLVAHFKDGRREEIGSLHDNEAAAESEAGYWRRVLRCEVRVGQVECVVELPDEEQAR